LRGAEADADDMVQYLRAMGVDDSSIHNLRGCAATRRAIIDGFLALKDDPRIEKGDPILVFYAGHGARTPAPSGWEAGEYGASIEMILPHNFSPQTTSDPEEQGIPDFTLAGLFSMLAREKGDNIVSINLLV
jgi:hypothetical protein